MENYTITYICESKIDTGRVLKLDTTITSDSILSAINYFYVCYGYNKILSINLK
jgi:hypothetical protein